MCVKCVGDLGGWMWILGCVIGFVCVCWDWWWWWKRWCLWLVEVVLLEVLFVKLLWVNDWRMRSGYLFCLKCVMCGVKSECFVVWRCVWVIDVVKDERNDWWNDVVFMYRMWIYVIWCLWWWCLKSISWRMWFILWCRWEGCLWIWCVICVFDDEKYVCCDWNFVSDWGLIDVCLLW